MFTLTVDNDIALKLLEKADEEVLFTLVDGSRDYLREWLPWVDATKQVEDYEPIIEMWLKQFAAHDGFQVGILYKNKLVGMAGFHGIDWSNKKTSIGYWLTDECQGNGIMTRVVQKLIDHAFTTYHLNRVEIQCGVYNKKSRGIPERLGLKQDGIIRDGEFLYDHYHDLALYSVLAREWELRG